MAQIQILSDLHLESPRGYDVFEITPRAPYLALLGDIGNIGLHKDDLLSFFRKQLLQFKIVFFVLGNHEAYHSSWTNVLGSLRSFEQDANQTDAHGNFVVLDRVAYRIPDTRTLILGCSLFSHVPTVSTSAVEMGLQDFYQIDEWDIAAHNLAHDRDLAWLNSEAALLSTCEEIDNVAIFTHWSPTYDLRAMDSKHAQSKISSGFCTDLSRQPCFVADKVSVWAFGHTHYNCDFTTERENGRSLRLLTNQRGYYHAQAESFDESFVIEV